MKETNPKWQHPGGKLRELGADKLSDAELLSILISTGVKGKTAEEIDKEIGYKEGEANQLDNIGVIYGTKGDLDQALKYYNEALKIFEEIGMTKQIGIVKGNIERISQQKKK
jgi:DNA repair protein RadC